MRLPMSVGAITIAAATLAAAGCETTNDYYLSACERDYVQNRREATAAGALVGAAIGAAIDDENDARGAAIGAAIGGLVGRALSREEDPCGYGFGGYVDNRREYDRYANNGYYGRDGYYDQYGRWHPRY